MNFKPKKSTPNKEFDSSNSEDDIDSDSFDAMLGNNSSPEKERAAPKRAAGILILSELRFGAKTFLVAAANAKFNFDSEDEVMKSDSEFEDNVQMGSKPEYVLSSIAFATITDVFLGLRSIRS